MPRSAAPKPMQDLLRRVAELEARVARLERRGARAAPARAATPAGDGRAAAQPPAPGVERCPGCGLALRRRKGRCVECGFPVDAR